MYSAYKLNKQGDSAQPWCTPFPIWNQSVVPCPVLTVTLWSAYRFSQEAGRLVWNFHFFKNFPLFGVIHTVKGFSIVNEAEDLDDFLEFSCFFYNPTDVGNLISSFSAFSKSNLNIWRFLFHMLLKPRLENFEQKFPSIWDDCNCVVVWTFFDIAFLWDWNENWPFPVLWPLLSFPNFLAYWVQHFHSFIFRMWNSSAGITLSPLVLFIEMLPKKHLTSHSKMSGSRWVITPLWLPGSWRSFLYISSMYSCHRFLISSASPYHFCPLLCPSFHEKFPWCL